MGLDLQRDLGTPRLTFARARRIIEHLAPDTATARARRDYRPTIDQLLLRRVELHLHRLWWAQTKDAKAGRNVPTPVPLHGDDVDRKAATANLDAKLARLEARRAARRADLTGSGRPSSTATDPPEVT